MSYTPRDRDRYRLAVAAVTGLTSIAAITATGWIASAASADYQSYLAQRAAAKRAAAAEWAKQQAEYQAKLAAYEANNPASRVSGRVTSGPAASGPQEVVDGGQTLIGKVPTTTRPSVSYAPGTDAGEVGPGGEVAIKPGAGTNSSTPTPTPTPTPDPTPTQSPEPTAAPPPPPPPPPPPSSGS
ncbi:MAG: hypothetical protein ACRCYU_09920 [Nocardioides sp.]